MKVLLLAHNIFEYILGLYNFQFCKNLTPDVLDTINNKNIIRFVLLLSMQGDHYQNVMSIFTTIM